jgi:Phage terminase, small subunit
MMEGIPVPRKSAAALAVLPGIERASTRLHPRAELPANVREIFIELANAAPVGHLKACDAPLLESYAWHLALARQAQHEIDANGPVVAGKASPWLTVLNRANRACVMLSGRLRFAPQSRADPKTILRGLQRYRAPSAYDEVMLDG